MSKPSPDYLAHAYHAPPNTIESRIKLMLSNLCQIPAFRNRLKPVYETPGLLYNSLPPYGVHRTLRALHHDPARVNPQAVTQPYDKITPECKPLLTPPLQPGAHHSREGAT